MRKLAEGRTEYVEAEDDIVMRLLRGRGSEREVVEEPIRSADIVSDGPTEEIWDDLQYDSYHLEETGLRVFLDEGDERGYWLS